MSEFIPVRTVSDLETLDQNEIVLGYWSGFEGDSEPGNNHSRSFWHGWRNGASDKRFREIDADQRALAREIVSRQRAT